MKLGWLGNRRGWHFRDLQRAIDAGPHPIELVPLGWSQLAGELNSEVSQVGIATADGVEPPSLDLLIVRAMAPGTLQEIVLRMDLLAEWERQGIPIVNPPRAMETAVDKYLALCRIRSAGLPIPRTAVLQDSRSALHFVEKWGTVVLKPLFGSEGKGLFKADSARMLASHLESLSADAVADARIGQVFYLQEYIEHDQDFRVLVIGRRVFGMRRENRTSWITNLAQGGLGSAWMPDETAAELARQAAKSVNATFAGVDLIRDGAGRWKILEVNSSPGWQHLSKVCDEDIAERLVWHLLDVARLPVGRPIPLDPGF